MFTAYKRSFGPGNIFTGVWLSIGRLASQHASQLHDQGCLPLGDLPPRVCLQEDLTMGGLLPRGLFPGGLCSGVSASRGSASSGVGPISPGSAYRWVCILGGWADPPPQYTWDTTGYGQEASGTHPTGMLSYVVIIVMLLLLFFTNSTDVEMNIGSFTLK